MRKKIVKIISVVLILLLIAQTVPLSVFAVDNLITEEQIEEKFSVTELTEYRDEYSKVYMLNDGNFFTILTADSMHYLDNIEWCNIDKYLSFKK